MPTECVLEKNGYTGMISYVNTLDTTYPKSKRYNLKIIKDNKIFINSYGFTFSGAKAKFYRWVSNKNIEKEISYGQKKE